MEFRTEIQLKRPSSLINIEDGIITIGSCFSDEIGTRMQKDKFTVMVNPFGTVYNPVSIHKLLTMATMQETPRADGYCQREGIFVHHDFHSAFADTNQHALANKLTDQLKAVHDALKKSKVLIITYGTAWVYEQKSTKQVVANCHKIPQQQFETFLITQKRVLESFESLKEKLWAINPSLQIITTVSPVRHVKDTLELNTVSKSVLRLACHTLAETYSHISYFPAYEIMLDDLRDYRFYEPDLIHPTGQATDYIWQKFAETYLTGDAKSFLATWNTVKSGLQHRSFNPSGESHQNFLRNLLIKLKAVRQLANVEEEIATVENQLTR